MEWIKVSERLPDFKEKVLASHKDGITVCDLDYDGNWYDSSDDFKCYPTHWMPLPALPKED